MFDAYLKKVAELTAQGVPFVVAIVVNYKPPISGKPGNRAIITADGTIWGWIAGGCSQGIIVEEALDAMKTGSSRYIKITPDFDDEAEGIVNRKMTCHSGGTLEVFLEPMITPLSLTIIGTSSVAQSLCTLAKALDYQVVALGEDSAHLMPAADKSFKRFDDYQLAAGAYVVVCTQGEGDELALEYALKSKPAYCAFVASHKKAETVRDYLKAQGLGQQAVDDIKAPAGLDLKASRPQEIALSIMAEIVMNLRSSPDQMVDLPKIKAQAIDPICGMKVTIDSALHIAQYEGQDYYFCCGGCKMAFESNPQQYVSQ